jgi:kinesin family protein C2/C3
VTLLIYFTAFALLKIFMFSVHAQIARLKSALAVKDSGSEQIMSRDSDTFNMKMPSPGFSNRRQGSCDLLSGQTNFRQPMEDVGNIEVTMF